MKAFTSYLLLFIFSLLWGGCGEDETSPPINQPTIIDATGKRVPLLPPPSKIVSFAPSITQNIYSLGEQDRLIGVTKYCQILPGETKQIIGNVINQNIEQIILLKPDLVLATKEVNKPETTNKLREYGFRAFVFSEVKSWADIQQEFLQLGTLLGKSNEAKQILAQQQQHLDTIRHSIPPHRPKVFVQQSEQLHTVTKDTFIDEAISQAGGSNIAHNALGRWPMLSIEEVINQDPDLIIIPTMGEITEQAKAMWQKFPALKAVKNNKIVVIDADICCQPTPENFVRLVEIIAEMLH